MKSDQTEFAALAIAVLIGCTVATSGFAIEPQFRLVAGDTNKGDAFGHSVALGGTRALVGAPAKKSAYLFDVATGQHLGSLTPDLPTNSDRFGTAVAIGEHVAVVGAYGRYWNGYRAGAAFLFDVATGRQIAQLTADTPTGGEEFGWAVDVDGDFAIVGANGENVYGADSGAAYVFDTTTGAQISKLVPSDGAAKDYFGYSVALSGNIALVGAMGDDDNGTNSGSMYLFDVNTGSQLGKLHATGQGGRELFGYSIAVHDDTAIVGAPVFGAPLANPAAKVPGAAYLFNISTGSQIARLATDDGAWTDAFGWSVAIDGNTALVGAHKRSLNPPTTNPEFVLGGGVAYLFDLNTGRQIETISPDALKKLDNFGFATALDSGKALVGAPQALFVAAGDPIYPGSAYLFDVNRQSQVPEPATAILLIGFGTGLFFLRQQTCRDGS